MAATYPSPSEEVTLQHFPDGSRDLENPPSHPDGAGSESQRSMRPRSSQPPMADSSPSMSLSPRGITPSWKQHLQVFGKYLLILVLIVAITAIVAALGVLTAPVSAVLLVVFLITYSFTRPAQILGNKKLEYITRLMMVGFTGVALLLFVALVVLFSIFRSVPSLESKKIVDMEVWKWLEIALVSCLFGIIWIGGSFLWTYVQLEYDYKKNLIYFVNASRWAVNCVCFFGGELLVLKVAPGSKTKVVIYGLPIWKWIAVIDLIICACHVIRIVTRAIILLLDAYRQNDDGGKNNYNKYVVYMAKGLRGSVNVVLFLVLILLTWAFYVHDRLDLDHSTDDAKRFLRYAKGTFLSLLVGSVLWVFKKFLLLLWEARQVYKRLTDRMLKAWMQLYFLIMIVGLEEAELVNWSIHGNDGAENQGNKAAEDDQQQPEEEEEDNGGHQHEDANSEEEEELQVPNPAASTGSRQVVGNTGDVGGDQSKKTGAEESAASKKKKEDRKKRKTQNAKDVIQQILGRAKKQTLNYDVLQRMSGYLVAADALWTAKEDAGSTDSVSSKISYFGEKWRKEQYPDNRDRKVSIKELGEKVNKMITEKDNSRDNGEDKSTTSKVSKDKLNQKDLQLLYAQLQEVDRTRKEVRYGDLEKWLTRAYRHCQTLGRALAGNKEGAVYLDKIMTVAVATTVLIVWLFLVKLATIELFAAIASPLIAVAFIFGDSAKTLFQGMIFVFGVHPFDVGDICLINDTQTLEVKRLGIWKTVFLKEGCKDEEVIYPNSALATATIVKHKNVLDLNDYLEFHVSKIGTTEPDKGVRKLKKDIKGYLNDRDEKFDKKYSQVVVKELADKVKIGVRFKHLMSFQDMSYLECLKKKDRSTSDLLEHIMGLVDDYEKKAAYPQTENGVAAEQGDG